MDCPQCGALVQEDQEICPACGSEVPRRSFWQRLLKFLFPVQVTRTKVTHTSKVEVKGISFIVDKETGKRHSLDDIPPELRTMLENDIASGQTHLLSLSEIPPELRATFQDAIASGQAHTKQVFSYQGPDGQMHTCHSFEELPDNIRDKFQEAIASRQGDRKEIFSYQGPDGRKHIYHSLEEMPENIRAIFQVASKLPRQE